MSEEMVTIEFTYLGHNDNEIIVEDYEQQEIELPRRQVKLPPNYKVGRSLEFKIPASVAAELGLEAV